MQSLMLHGIGILVALAAACSDGGDGGVKNHYYSQSICGNGVVENSEHCDPGDQRIEGCGRNCFPESGWICEQNQCHPICGDNQVVGNEVCDESNVVTGRSYCSDECSSRRGRCGDGVILESVETCDPGTGANIRGCDQCGNGRGFKCNPAQNSCVASDIPLTTKVSEYTDNEWTKFCAWEIGLFGGENSTRRCDYNGQAYDVRIATVGECVSKSKSDIAPELPNCTTLEMEDFFLEYKDFCYLFFYGGWPACRGYSARLMASPASETRSIGAAQSLVYHAP